MAVVRVRGGGRFKLDELHHREKRFLNIPWKGPAIRSPGGLQYDNGSLAVGDGYNPVIYQSSDGVVTGTTQLAGICGVSGGFIGQFYIDGDKVIVPSTCKTGACWMLRCASGSMVSIFNYPAGGAPITSISGFKFAYGAVISR